MVFLKPRQASQVLCHFVFIFPSLSRQYTLPYLKPYLPFFCRIQKLSWALEIWKVVHKRYWVFLRSSALVDKMLLKKKVIFLSHHSTFSSRRRLQCPAYQKLWNKCNPNKPLVYGSIAHLTCKFHLLPWIREMVAIVANKEYSREEMHAILGACNSFYTWSI